MKLTNDILKRAMPDPGKRLELRDDDEPGLIFRVTESGARSWSLRYRNAAGEQRRKSLGAYPSVTLSKAREEARKIKGAVAGGTDVVGDDRAKKAFEATKRLHTMAGLADAYFADAAVGLHRANTRSPKRQSTINEERRIWDRLVAPVFGKRAVADITRAEVEALVRKATKGAVSNGRHCRTVVRQLLTYAVWKGIIDANPAHDIAVVMSKPRERVMTDDELRAFWMACLRPGSVDDFQMSLEMGRALRMAAVTLQRGGEVVGMRWAEIDRAHQIWTVPASRMKGKRTHLVPLSGLAMSILEEADGGGEFVFPSPRSDEHLDRRAFSRAMNRMMAALKLPPATPHDLRRTGATVLTSERLGVPRFIVSQVLAHAGDTGGAAAVTGLHYDRNDYLVEKRRALGAWAELLEAIVTNPKVPS
ncbi:tyrosine-type recombinase/integrase [Acuticoccus sediminis]|uniref:tyrosine-type recombinase/integrase n=1 Tax=Acuticoccus sediminis TaxID=2184697 RepID=UPI001CFE08B1|nr:site-specific integrase [Acuticoccus sediminis]